MNLKMMLPSAVRPFRRRTGPGASPGTVVALPDEPPPQVRVIAYGPDGVVEEQAASVSGLAALTQRSAVTWVNVDGLGDAAVIQQLGNEFQLHPLALEDVMNPHQRPKVEAYDDHLFIVARSVSLDEHLETEQIALFVGKNYVLTIQEGLPGDCFDPVRERIRKTVGRIRHSGADYLAYALLDAIIDNYFPVLDRYGDMLDDLDEQLMSGGDGESVAQIHKLRSDLSALRRALRPHQEVFNELVREEQERFSERTRLYLRDCLDHVLQIAQTIDHYHEYCSDLRDYHLVTLSHRSNEAMKTLTVIATLFIPLSFVAGLYGMNFQHMPELHWVYGYPMALAIMASIGGSLLAWFWRRGWFRG